jgi:hypothetical protein
MVITTEPNDIKERLSIAYVTAIAARAGCEVSEPKIDKQSIDVTVKPIRGRKVSIDLQLKATSVISPVDGTIAFDLPVNNYDSLRDRVCTAPHYLVLLLLHANDGSWLEGTDEALIIRRCAYWLDLKGQPATTNKETIRVQVPQNQPFNVTALEAMMRRAFESIRPPEGEAA